MMPLTTSTGEADSANANASRDQPLNRARANWFLPGVSKTYVRPALNARDRYQNQSSPDQHSDLRVRTVYRAPRKNGIGPPANLPDGGQSFVDLSRLVIDPLRRDEEFVLYGGEYRNLPDTPSVPLLAADSALAAVETFASRSSAERALSIF